MKKIHILLLLSMLLPIISSAQKKRIYMRAKCIGESSTSYYYRYMNNELSRDVETMMILQVGDTVQKFTSCETYLSDSLGYALGNQLYDHDFIWTKIVEISRCAEAKNGLDWTLYINLPEGHNTITDRVFMDHFISEEKSIIPTWDLLSETKMIQKYECQKATTQLYGRTWTVWFTPKIVVPCGPWLLRGLPGLIVEAVDDSGELKFELQRIERRKTPIISRIKDYFKADRNEVLKAKRKYYMNMGQYIQGSTLVNQMSDIPSTAPRRYNPPRKIED